MHTTQHILTSLLLLSVLTHAEPLTTNRAIQYGLQHNRQLQRAQYTIDNAKTALKFAGRRQNPELDITYTTDQFGENQGEQSIKLGLTQALPLTSHRRKEKNLRRLQLHTAQIKITAQKHQLTHDIEQTILQLTHLQQQLNTQENLKTINQEITTFLKQQAQRGEASTLDITQATLTNQNLEQKKHLLQARAQKTQLDLKLLLGYPIDRPLTLAPPPTLPTTWDITETTKETLLQNQPQMRLARAHINTAALKIKLEKARRWDDAAIHLSVEQEKTIDNPNDLEKNTLAGIGFTIPLPLITQNNQAIQHAKIAHQTATAQHQALAYKQWTAYQQALQTCKAAFHIAQQTNSDLTTLAQQNFNDTRHAYQQGQTSLLHVQRAQEQLLDIQTATLKATHAYFSAAAHLRLLSPPTAPKQ